LHPQSQQSKRKSTVLAKCGDNPKATYSGPGIKQLPNGKWWVQVAWRGFKVSTNSPIADLEQAANIHIALCEIRNAARARHKALETALINAGCKSKDLGDLEDCPVMNHAEYLKLLREEPFVPLTFSTDTVKTFGRVQTPWTPSLESAFHFRSLSKGVLNLGGKIATIKPEMAEQARKDRDLRCCLARDAAVRVGEEASRRGKAPAPKEPVVAKLEPKPVVLALKEISAAEELAKVQAVLEKEREQHALALKDEKHSADIWRQASVVEAENYVHIASLREQEACLREKEACLRLKEAFRAELFAKHWKLEAERNKELEESRNRSEAEAAKSLRKAGSEAVRRAYAEEEARRVNATLMQVLQEKSQIVVQEKSKTNVNPFLRKPSGLAEPRATRFMAASIQATTRSSSSSGSFQRALRAATYPNELEPYEMQGATAGHRWRQRLQ